MKILFFLFILLKLIPAQTYTISVFGFPVAEVKQTLNRYNEITYNTENTGITSLIWPGKNFYSTRFDSISFGIRGWMKNIHQGEYKKKISINFNNTTSELIYNSKTKVRITDSTHTIFTLLAMVQAKDYKTLDTKWFNFVHEGQKGRARFIWSDTTTIPNKKNKILCDHYRLDISLNDNSGKFWKESDYFMDEIISTNIVRQLWVSREIKKRIIQASINSMGFPILALINE